LTCDKLLVTVSRMLYTRHCALPECGIKFDTDNPQKRCCTEVHGNRLKVRNWRKNKRKKGGGNDGPGGGLRATYGGAVELAATSDKDLNRYSDNSHPKPPLSVTRYTERSQKAAA
jgi:hypothetical protein